jgi:uncharacterized membrane protein (UPF0136 family)
MNTAKFMMAYGAFVFLGGVIGAIASGSLVSLISGGASGALAFVSGLGLQRGSSWARPLGFVVAGFLALFFLWRMINAFTAFPALATFGLSIVALALLYRDLQETKSASKS